MRYVDRRFAFMHFVLHHHVLQKLYLECFLVLSCFLFCFEEYYSCYISLITYYHTALCFHWTPAAWVNVEWNLRACFQRFFFLCGKKRPHKTLGVLSSSVLTENWPHSHNILKNWYIRMYRICAEVFLCVWQGSWAQRRDGLSIVGVEKTPSFQLSSCQGN